MKNNNSVKIIAVLGIIIAVGLIAACVIMLTAGSTSSESDSGKKSSTKSSSASSGKDSGKSSSSKKNSDISSEVESYILGDAVRYAKSKLSGNGAGAYDDVVNAVLAFDEEVSVEEYGLDIDEFNMLYACIRNDYPEIFWIGGDSEILYNDDDIVTDFNPNYLYSENDIKKMISTITKKTEGLIEEAEDMDDYEKAMLAFDYIVDNTVYKEDNDYSHNIYGVFGKGKAVCEGYAKAYQYLTQAMGLECIYITGNSKGEGHAWNYIKIDKDWYGVDVTWCDPQGDKEIKSHAYCMMDDSRLKASHKSDVPYGLPSCKGSKYEYFKYNGLVIDDTSSEALSEVFARAYEKDNKVLEFRCEDKEIYKEVSSAVKNRSIDSAFKKIKKDYGVSIGSMSYGFVEDALVVRIEI